MNEHPIQGLMVTAMENLKEMVDVNKIIGDAVETPDGYVIIPVSKVSFGFMAGGSEFETSENGKNPQSEYPFGGGSGGGVSVQPVAFLIVGSGEIRLIPVEGGAVLDRIVDLVPQLSNYVQNMFNKDHKNDKQSI